MSGTKLKTVLSFIGAILLSTGASADWQLSSDASSFYYVTSKSSAISEVNSFSELSGSIDAAGNAVLRIELVSVDTLIEVRNQRVRDILFEVSTFPQAIASLEVDIESLDSMEPGTFVINSYQVSLDIHGVSSTFNSELQVTKLSSSTVQIQLAMPLVISASTFGLEGGIEELREIASLPSINGNVVIGFNLLFEK